MPGRFFRPSFSAGLLALTLAGCASSGSRGLYSREVPYPPYASAEAVRGMERSTLCHQGNSITIVNIAVDAHLRHGDYFGACGEDNRARHDAYYRAQTTPPEAGGQHEGRP